MADTDRPHPVKLGGVTGSPYTRKMRAVLRYRRIPFQWVPRNSQWDDFAEVPVQIIPVLALPEADGTYPTAMVDSSPQIMVLEQWQSGRSIVTTDPVMAFVDDLVEDYGDEWCTKMMFHYRWNRHHPAGIENPPPHAAHQALSVDDRAAVDDLLAGTGCEQLLTS